MDLLIYAINIINNPNHRDQLYHSIGPLLYSVVRWNIFGLVYITVSQSKRKTYYYPGLYSYLHCFYPDPRIWIIPCSSQRLRRVLLNKGMSGGSSQFFKCSNFIFCVIEQCSTTNTISPSQELWATGQQPFNSDVDPYHFDLDPDRGKADPDLT